MTIAGDEDDGVLRLLRKHNIPVTRENYITVAYCSEPPDPWTWEHEEDLPEHLRIPFDDANPPPQPGS
ncbi:hypothetical protein AAII07_59295 [Microvirga sp. 0TCS3.31]